MQHTAKEMGIVIGKKVNIEIEQWIVPMTILDAKSAWGKVRLLVRPVTGEGEAWIDWTRIVTTSADARRAVAAR